MIGDFRKKQKRRLELKSSLDKPSDKCPRTHIIQNLFHDAYLLVQDTAVQDRGDVSIGEGLI